MPENTFIERIEILSRHRFGQRVMQWADGTLDVPKDLAQAEQQLQGIVTFPMPSYIKSLRFIPTTKEVWTIKLPPPEMLADTRQRIDAGEAYLLPNFYGDRVLNNLTDNHMLFECRVGDYTCSLCT